MALRLPEVQRRQPLGELAAVWVTLDPARADKLLAAVGPDSFNADMAVSGIVARLMKRDPEKAVPWLDRFGHPDDVIAQSNRSQVAVRLAERDLHRAVRLAEGIGGPVYRALTLARLATVARKVDPRLANDLIEKAAAAVVTEPKPEAYEPGQRVGVAVYLLWQAEAVAYPDRASLVAMALTARPPVPAHEHQAETWRSQTVRLAAGVGSLDPAAGRALLGPHPDRDLADAQYAEDYGHEWLIALALADPAAATRQVGDGPDPETAADVLAVLGRRSAVTDRLRLMHGLWWVREGGDATDIDPSFP
jgi:hypothetical protein